MFIELTDHLRCPVGHPESFLVLIPDVMDGRGVGAGVLGCPVCQAEFRITEGVALFGDPPPAGSAAAGLPPAEGLLAFLGLEGPGGYVALIGDAARQATALAPLLPGVHLVLVNPPEGSGVPATASVLRAATLPLKARSMRGVVLGAPEAGLEEWQSAAVRAALPGRQVAGTGAPPMLEEFELLGSAAGWWVGRRKT
jgi:hypothetical protein